MIYCTNCGSQGQPQFYGGSSWYNVLKGAAVLNGTTDPTDAVGSDEDFYINTSRVMLFGPKANGTWPAGVSLFGSEGPPGADGATGADGAQGLQGDPGPPGADGAQGLPGNDGIDGWNGIDGILPNGNTIGAMPFWDGGQWNLNSNIYNVVFNNDTFVGIGNPSPGHALDVNGTVNATSFIGDGSLITGITIHGHDIENNSIPHTKLAEGSVTSAAIAYGSVTEEKLADVSVSAFKLQEGSVTSYAIADGSVTSDEIADGSVSENKLAGLSVSSTHLQLDSVAEDNLQDGSISINKIKVSQNNLPGQGKILTTGLIPTSDGPYYFFEWESPSNILVDLTTDQTVSGSKSFQHNVRIGLETSSETATPTAALEIASTNQGFLPPRMTAAERDDIEFPADGLIIFCTNCGPVGQPQFSSGWIWYNMLGGTAAAAQ
jgi:hypothetical protein